MNKQLLILPFDHRSSFSKDLLGATGKLTNKQKKEIEKLKQIIFAGFLKTAKQYPKDKNLGILVDEQFGLKILSQAKKIGITTCLPMEKSGQPEFQIEYGNSFKQHIEKIKPDWIKVLVRYNPLNTAVNQRQITELKKVNQFCKKNKYPLLFELLVPPTDKDLKLAGSQAKYDQLLRPKRTIQAIKEIKRHISVDIWKMEWLSVKDWPKAIKTINKNAKIIILGRGENEKLVKGWLKAAAGFDQIIGFAIGRTVFFNALKKYLAKSATSQQTIDAIAKKFNSFIKFWDQNKK